MSVPADRTATCSRLSAIFLLMKVAYVIPSLQKPSGWRSMARDFLGAIRNFLEPVLFVPAAQLSEARSLFPDLEAYPLSVTQAASLGNPRGLLKLASVYVAIGHGRWPKVDLVHSLEAYPTGLVGLWLARRIGCPHVLTAHGTYGVVWSSRPVDHQVYAWVLRNTDLVCPISTGTAHMMQAYFAKALAGTRLQPILNGNDFYLRVAPCPPGRPLPPVPTLLSVGDIKPRKGQHISLAAFARLKEVMPEARYWIAGRPVNGSYFKQLQQTVSEQKLQDVEFLGAVSDEELDRRYRATSLFVLTPQPEGLHFEGFGLVYLEAGAYSLPVVGTRTGGVPDAVKDGVTGLLAEPEDVEGLSQAMLRLLNDPGLNRRMGEANRRWAETLTWERSAREQLAAYQELLEHQR